MPYEINQGVDATRVVSSTVTAITRDAKGNYSSGGIPQWSVVKKYTSGNVDDVVVATTGDYPDGVVVSTSLGNGPSQSCSVRQRGTVKVLASGAVTIGQLVYVANASGQAGPIPADGATSVYLLGQAKSPATNAGDLFMVDLMIGSQHVTS